MKIAKTIAGKLKTKNGQKLRFREIGKGFVTRKPGPNVMAGMCLKKTYADQYQRQYVMIDGSYELITEEHSYLPA